MPVSVKISPAKGQPVDMERLETNVLKEVNKPGRYMGLEEGAYRKPFKQAKVRMVFTFPDLYEIGISNYGMKLLYSVVNQHKDYMCDRAYAVAKDMKEKLAEEDIPLFGVESKVPIKDFDLIAFSLQYELNYTTILGALETAQIPFRSADRSTMDYPILIAGGPGSGNPMPLSPFFDAFIIGDGEEVLIEILDVIRNAKQKRLTKPELMEQLSQVIGVYIPGVTERAEKRIIDIAETQVDIAPLVPSVASIHDRVTIEARRGCDRMCRFCQPCFINLPVREQSIENIKKNALAELEKTGYEECSLLSLSIADYSYFKPLILEVADVLKEKNVSLSLPSQRADRFSTEVAEAVQSIRKSTLTFAPEAGTARMRDVINKNLSDDEIMKAVTSAYQSGWNKVKLYFMIGLPTETNADLDGIADMIRRLQAACREIRRDSSLSIKKVLEINVTLSNFVPKPHTPFQWFPQDSMAMIKEKRQYIRQAFKGIKGVKLNFTDPEISKLEAVISKGGPELADVLELAYLKGAYLDAWDEMEPFQKWFEALAEKGFEPESYTRERLVDIHDNLPWDPIDMGLTKKWLQAEYARATEETSTTPCFEECSVCGVCATYSTWPKFIETPKTPPRLKVKTVKASTEIVLPQMKKPVTCKVRVGLQKAQGLRFISHLDWLRLVYRAIIRAKIPVAYSQGFNPKPRVAFTQALPMFMESYGEYVDIDLTEPMDRVCEALNRYLPEGGKATGEELLQRSAPGLARSIETVSYSAQVPVKYIDEVTCQNQGFKSKIKEQVELLVNQSTLPVECKTKKATKIFDIAPYLENLRFDGEKIVQFEFRFPTQQEGDPVNLKPEWVLSLIHPEIQWSITRTGMTLKDFKT